MGMYSCPNEPKINCGNCKKGRVWPTGWIGRTFMGRFFTSMCNPCGGMGYFFVDSRKWRRSPQNSENRRPSAQNPDWSENGRRRLDALLAESEGGPGTES